MLHLGISLYIRDAFGGGAYVSVEKIPNDNGTARFAEFKHKEIIDVSDGAKIGYVDDIVFDTETADIVSIIVYGRYRFFGLFGRDDDMVINWSDIEIIGTDTILVKAQNIEKARKPSKINYFDKLFG